MREATLVIMAAGRGSRFGGLKQLEDVDGRGHSIIDYSVYDAVMVGFSHLVFVINRDIEAVFRKKSDTYPQKYDISVDYAYQEIDDLPAGIVMPIGRKKPWGTAHAVACLDGVVSSAFALINADDLYGREAFYKIHSFLISDEAVGQNYAMVGYKLANTLSKNGSVSRGICKTDGKYLTELREISGIFACNNEIFCDGESSHVMSDSLTSVNLWGFTPSIIEECNDGFRAFLKKRLDTDPNDCEFFLPELVSQLIKEGKARVRILENGEIWQGITYREDVVHIRNYLTELVQKGKYPTVL